MGNHTIIFHDKYGRVSIKSINDVQTAAEYVDREAIDTVMTTADIITVPVDSNHLNKDAFLAKVMLTENLNDKFEIIASKDMDNMPIHDWEESLLVLSTYLNMSVCDILEEIEHRRNTKPINVCDDTDDDLNDLIAAVDLIDDINDDELMTAFGSNIHNEE